MIKSYSNYIKITAAPTRSQNVEKHLGLLNIQGNTHNCSLGKTGLNALKREADNATPIGRFKILYGYYRSDRINLPATGLSMIPITKNLGWCDDPKNANYNLPITLPYKHSHEVMMREDRLYDICLVMDYNIPNRKSYKGRNYGSAIFFHLTKTKTAPTQGCIAIELELMLQILPKINSNTVIDISI